MTEPVRSVEVSRYRGGDCMAGERHLPEETPVAFVYGGTVQAVMMATPADLADFGRGFSLTEGIVERADQIERIEIVDYGADGIELRIDLASASAERLEKRRRRQAGPVGCGLCGIDSLAEAIREPRNLIANDLRLSPDAPAAALDAMIRRQPLHHQTHAVHAAGFWTETEGLVAVREDVGRHNAIDKLVGALIDIDVDASRGAIVMTSRLSVEIVQKCAAFGCPALFAVSAPTARAVAMAEKAGLTIAASVRDGGFELFSHPRRMVQAEPRGERIESRQAAG